MSKTTQNIPKKLCRRMERRKKQEAIDENLDEHNKSYYPCETITERLDDLEDMMGCSPQTTLNH